MMEIIVYNLKGTSDRGETSYNNNIKFIELNGRCSFDGDDLLYDIQNECIKLHQLFEIRIFQSHEEYYKGIESLPIWISQAGMDSDFSIDADTFSRLVQNNSSEKINKHLYLKDCQSIVSFVQNRIESSKNLFSLFYKELFLIQPLVAQDKGIFWSSGYMAENIFSILNNLIITNCSILDQITKLAVQAENMATKFSSWPKLSSRNILFGSKNKIRQLKKTETIFEHTKSISFFDSLRNELIHNGTWEVNPKVFFEFSSGTIIQKYIYVPDMDGRSIKTVKNRKRFFSQENKVNLMLPEICFDFWSRVYITLSNISIVLSES